MATFANNANNAAALAAFEAVLRTGNLPAIEATWGALFRQGAAAPAPAPAPTPTPPSTPAAAAPKRTASQADVEGLLLHYGDLGAPSAPSAPKKAKKTKKVAIAEPVEAAEPAEAVEVVEEEAEPAPAPAPADKPLSKKAQKALKRPRAVTAYNVFMSELSAKLKKKNWNPDGLEGAALHKARFAHAAAEWKKVPEAQQKGKWQNKAEQATATKVALWEAGQPLADEEE